MAGSVRSVLDDLDKSTLRRLCDVRGLSTALRLDDMRASLAHSYRGEHRELLAALTRKDMQALLALWEFKVEERVGVLAGLTQASHAELARAVARVYIDGWAPTTNRLHPLGENSKIRLSFEDDELDEVDDLDAEAESSEGANSLGHDAGQDEADEDTEAQFIAALRNQLAGRTSSSILIKTLVNKLGRHRAQSRLRLAAVRHLGRVLADAGIATEPDLTNIAKSPGIDKRVKVIQHLSPSRSGSSSDENQGFREPVGTRPPSLPLGAPRVSVAQTGFELANEKLKFLVSLATAIQPCDERTRLDAVSAAGSGLDLGPADHIRLKALAHQYTGGHSDLRHTVVALRTKLSQVDRTMLLESLRGLAPSCAALDEMIVAYAGELEVEVTTAPLKDQTLDAANLKGGDSSMEKNITGVPPEPTAPKAAGGVRANDGLDSIFSGRDE